MSVRGGLIFLVALSSTANAAVSQDECHDSGDVVETEWVNDGGFMILLLTIVLCFWGMAVVCEDYYVPALKIMCLDYKISDAVAGSTFMAAGASSPELFVSLSALFIEDSSVGLGTVVGSEIFNHLIIPAISIYYAKGGELALDYRIIIKDIVFYALSLMFLVVAIKLDSTRGYKEAFWPDSWEECLEVGPGRSTLLLFIYLTYALVTIYFGSVCIFLRLPPPQRTSPGGGFNMNMSPENPGADDGLNVGNPLNKDLAQEESDRDEQAAGVANGTGGIKGKGKGKETFRGVNPAFAGSNGTDGAKDVAGRKNITAGETRASSVRQRALSATEEFFERITGLRPIDTFDGFDEEPWEGATSVDSGTGTDGGESGAAAVNGETQLGMHLYVKNDLYASLGLYKRVWNMYYFTLSPYSLFCRKTKQDPTRGEHIKIYSLHDAIGVQAVNEPGGEHCFKLSYPDKAVTFKAVSAECMDVIMKKLGERIAEMSVLSADDKYMLYSKNFQAIKSSPAELEHLLEFPETDDSLWSKVWFWFTFPLRWMVSNSLWDMRIPSNRAYYGYTVTTCIAWLFVLSLILIECCAALGRFMHVSDTIIGITISAIGTSFPNMWSSVVVARQGLGDMAITNSLGSNIFNICIGLGFPWLLFTSINGGNYTRIADDGVTMLVFVLLIVLALYLIMLVCTNFVMKKWMSPVFISVYLTVIIIACLI